MEKAKIGLVLGSGGSRGLAHIGVLKVLSQENIPLACLAGSSIGALIGAHYALYQDIEKLEKLMLSNSWHLALKFFDPSLRGGLIRGEKIEKLFQEWFQNKKFSDLKIPFAAISTDLVTGDPYIFSRGPLAPAIRASISAPTVFQPFSYQKKLFIDGGVSNPLPIDIAKKLGAQKIIAVNLDTKKIKDGFNPNHITLVNVFNHSLNIARYHLVKNNLAQADVLLEPKIPIKTGFIGWKRFFSPTEAKKIIASGEKAARQTLPQIKKLFFSSPNKKEEIKSKKQ